MSTSYEDALAQLAEEIGDNGGNLGNIHLNVSGWRLQIDKPRPGYRTYTKAIDLSDGESELRANIQIPPGEPAHIELRVRERG